MSKIAVIGLWHQGLVGAACFAKAGFQVLGYDPDKKIRSLLEEGKTPIFEPGLDQLIDEQKNNGRLEFVNDIKSAIKEAEFVCIMFDTPVNEDDLVDPSIVIKTFTRILPYLDSNTIIWVTAQIPVGTCQAFKKQLEASSKTKNVGLAYSPENLRLGNAIDLFEQPQLPVIATNEKSTFHRLKEMLSFTYTNYNQIDLMSGEMVKHALNAFLATSVTFGNEIGNICDNVGADAIEIAQVLRLEPRIGDKCMILPGMGFSGGTLARDVQTLRSIGQDTGLDTPFLNGLWESNRTQNIRIIEKIDQKLEGFKGRNIAVWGLTYKAGTSTLRRSAALEMIHLWNQKGYNINASDPKADRNELKDYNTFNFFDDPYESVKKVDGLIIVTPWPEYREIDYTKIKDLMNGSLLADPNNYLDYKLLNEIGFDYLGVGRGKKL